MSKLTEITDLFARLACNLQNPDPTARNGDDQQAAAMDDDDDDLSFSNLNRSLNLEHNEKSSSSSSSARIRVLDTALSLMCFKAPQVYDTVIKYLIETLVTVLSSSIAVKPLKLQKTEFLSVGCEISTSGCAELFESCTDILLKLEGHGILYHSLLYATVRAAVSASCFSDGPGIVPVIDANSLERVKPSFSKLFSHLPRDASFNNEDLPLRLLFWHLDPLILKNDVSNILQDVIGRPFLCLATAFRERMEWRSILVCLTFSPAMFVEIRALLHNWFLMTGLASVLKLQIKLMSSILDVTFRPMSWDISMEVGLKLPSPLAFFPHNHHLLRTLEGPMLCQNLAHLVNVTNKSIHHPHVLDHKSQWAMAINFPNWFYFASTLLFCEKSIEDDFHSRVPNEAVTFEHPCVMEPAHKTATARYIAWILDPTSESHQKLLVEFLLKISESWVLKKCNNKDPKQQTSTSRKKFKKLKYHDRKDDCVLIQQWLEDFGVIYMHRVNRTVDSCSQGFSSQINALLRRIPLGILIGYSNEIDEYECQLLLHYAATGTLWNSRGLGVSSNFIGSYNKEETVVGICLVFDLTDIVESMSNSLFEEEQSGMDFICRVKFRAGRYLLNCVKRMLEIEKVEDFMLRDLYIRLKEWRLIGKDIYEGSKDLDDVVDALNHRLSS